LTACYIRTVSVIKLGGSKPAAHFLVYEVWSITRSCRSPANCTNMWYIFRCRKFGKVCYKFSRPAAAVCKEFQFSFLH